MKAFTTGQQYIIAILKQYPKDMVMRLKDGYFLTGGHGVKFDKRSFNSLVDGGVINRDGKFINKQS